MKGMNNDYVQNHTGYQTKYEELDHKITSSVKIRRLPESFWTQQET